MRTAKRVVGKCKRGNGFPFRRHARTLDGDLIQAGSKPKRAFFYGLYARRQLQLSQPLTTVKCVFGYRQFCVGVVDKDKFGNVYGIVECVALYLVYPLGYRNARNIRVEKGFFAYLCYAARYREFSFKSQRRPDESRTIVATNHIVFCNKISAFSRKGDFGQFVAKRYLIYRKIFKACGKYNLL